MFWLQNFLEGADLFNGYKTCRSHSNNRLIFEANMLADGVPKWLPEGDSYDLKAADMDPYLSASRRSTAPASRLLPLRSYQSLCSSV